MPGLLESALDSGRSAFDTLEASSQLAEEKARRDAEAKQSALSGLGSAIGTVGGLYISGKKGAATVKDADGARTKAYSGLQTGEETAPPPGSFKEIPEQNFGEDTGLGSMIGSLWHKLYNGF